MTNTQKLKLGIQKVQMKGPIIGCVRISDDPLAQPRGKFRPNFGPQFFLIDFTRILRFFWDLRVMLFDIHKNVVFPELLVFSNIFGFSAGSFHTKQ